MYTVLTMVESCLNSRPLRALSSDPRDCLPAIPQADEESRKLNHLSKCRMLERPIQHFWQRWSAEYLSRLQNRPKWWSKKPNLQPGDMVIIKDEKLTRQQWKLGRIMDTFTGEDGLVRTVTVKTATGDLKRPITKLAWLPIQA
ncbi:hypothetical protein PR048_008624 [Dryococelus australis]|uniref:DUF5641 domain-containing protein n=1 Tax=Dryococelus australis TaxID=614101 RepID=A0ABQ9HXP9_9NEOP|nr:hypothetical protein PR048_008624 [Dryococelus australis]